MVLKSFFLNKRIPIEIEKEKDMLYELGVDYEEIEYIIEKKLNSPDI
jgi:hypothetical protein